MLGPSALPQIDVEALAQGVVAAYRDTDGKLRLTSFEASAAGNIVAKRDELQSSGKFNDLEMLRTPHSGSNVTVVLWDEDYNLRLTSWLMSGNGTNLRRAGSSVAGRADRIAAAGTSRSYPGQDPRDMIITASADADGNLKLISWDTNLVD